MGPIKSMDAYLYKGIQTIYIISLLSFMMYIIFQTQLYLYMLGICLGLLGLFYVWIRKNNHEQMKHLISHADAIIEQKKVNVIDGEGDMSLLSHKLYTLSHRYNQLMKTMQQEQIQLKGYIEDISHQLKTPITSMRLNEELLLDVIEDNKQRDKLHQIYQQTLKMNHLVNDLLTLALLDSHSISFRFDDSAYILGDKKQPVFLQAGLCLSHTVSVLFLSMDILFTVRQDSRNHCPVYSASPSDQQYMPPLHRCLF